jgi:radical SAM superfamily enzyme YgiQ (UPF0313 family)
LLKNIAREEGVYFYINAYLLIGFPEFVLPNGKTLPAETEEERKATYDFAIELRDAGAIDFMLTSILIPLPATDMWEHLSIEQRVEILYAALPAEARTALDPIRREVLAESAGWGETRYREEPEAAFWRKVYALPDDLQLALVGAYDRFNADLSFSIRMSRADGAGLFAFRQQLMEEFFGGLRQEWKLMRHVFAKSGSLRDVLSYCAFLGRIYLPETRSR